MTAPWLGLAMIVRDAAKTLPVLLKSIEGIFDECIFVDTESTDDTREIIAAHYGIERFPDGVGPVIISAGGPRVLLTRFDWVNDFSAARQFSFELSTAKWRCYLDADDDATDLQRKLRPTLERTEKTHPETNCISMKYQYVPNEMAQDKLRIVRWADGWKWEDPVHEHLVRSGVNQGRVISSYTDMWVHHRPTDPGHSNKSWDRNLAIQQAAYANPQRPEKKALWAYYLANYAHEAGDHELARKYYREVGDNLGRNNITCEGLTRWARMELKLGNTEKAIDLAAEAIGKAPELPDGLVTLGVAHTQAGAHYRAAGIFDALLKQPAPPMETQHDAVWLDGISMVHAAISYYQTGRYDDAVAAVNRIPTPLLAHPDVIAAGKAIQVALAKTEGFNRLRALWEFLIWDTEPLKARELLERFCPAALSDSPQVKQLLRQMEPKLAHMNDWGAYQRTYAAIPELPYHVPKEHHGWTLQQGRARMVRQWAENLPHEGAPIEVLVIGVQDGIIESAMLEANPRIHLTACDVAPQASVGIQGMVERFPGRVKTHAVVENHCDWFPVGTTGSFDAIILFEVIEHVPNDVQALARIRQHLKPDGQFFLSTPIAAQWVEHYLSDLKDPRPWWHVRAHNPTSLWKLLQYAGFTGSLIGLGEETLFLAKMTPADRKLEGAPEITIYVYPLGEHGFDPFSPKLEAVGGSEEAVIHLSAALARKGCSVTVYTDSPKRRDQVFVHAGVRWRPHAEWDVASLTGTLLVWRTPQLAAQFKRENPRLRVLNWLHDTHYGVRA